MGRNPNMTIKRFAAMDGREQRAHYNGKSDTGTASRAAARWSRGPGYKTWKAFVLMYGADWRFPC